MTVMTTVKPPSTIHAAVPSHQVLFPGSATQSSPKASVVGVLSAGFCMPFF